MNKVEKIILHHSLTKDGTAKDFDGIKNYHIYTNGWKDIGYHYVIELVGDEYQIIKGRGEDEVGAHTKGENYSSIGICVVGNFDENYVPVQQLNKLIELIRDIRRRHGYIPIFGHRDFLESNTGYKKSCPGDKFPLEYLRNLGDEEQDWRIEIGKSALKELIDEGLIDTPNYWEDKLIDKIEVWAVFDIISTLISRRK